jgi:cytochrome P450
MPSAPMVVPPRQRPKMPISRSDLACYPAIFANTDPTRRDLLEYLAKLVDRRATDPKDDLISTLIAEQVGLLRVTIAHVLAPY